MKELKLLKLLRKRKPLPLLKMLHQKLPKLLRRRKKLPSQKDLKELQLKKTVVMKSQRLKMNQRVQEILLSLELRVHFLIKPLKRLNLMLVNLKN
tara:strand:+ start:966 stop:1250 length:285 start_codon:yes stop_codon:yes gene_type:complete